VNETYKIAKYVTMLKIAICGPHKCFILVNGLQRTSAEISSQLLMHVGFIKQLE